VPYIPEISNNDKYVSASPSPGNDVAAPAAEPAKIEVVANNPGTTTTDTKRIYEQLAFNNPYSPRGSRSEQSDQQQNRIDAAHGKTQDAINSARKLKDDAIARNAAFAAQKLGEAVAAAAGLASGISGLFKR
jgi:hypothetical protein